MVSTTAISSTFTTSNFKEWLSKHKVYNSLVDSALSENKKETLSSKSGEVSFGDKEMRNAIKKTFTPKLLQDITEDFIDGVDPWLKGKTDNPTFKIDLSDVKSSLATNIASAYKKSYAKLPLCQSGQIPSSDNVLTAKCRVPGINIDTELQKLVKDIKTSKDFLPNTVITSANLKTGSDDKTTSRPLFDSLKNLPTAYRLAHAGPYIFGLLSLAAAALLVFASKSRRRGLRRVAVPLVSSGAFLVISVLVINAAFKRIDKELVGGDKTQQILHDSIVPFLGEIKSSLASSVLVFGISFLVIAAGVFVYLIKTHRSKPTPTAKVKQAV